MNKVTLMKGHVTRHVNRRSGRHYLIAMMLCPVFVHRPHSCSVLCHRGWTDERLGQDQQWRDEERKEGRERERLHEETGDGKGGNMKKGGVRDEGEKGWAWWASESKVKSPLVWQLPACTLLFSWLSASTPSLRPDFCQWLHIEVGCFTCDVGATTEWAHWSGCVCVSVYLLCVAVTNSRQTNRSFLLWQYF